MCSNAYTIKIQVPGSCASDELAQIEKLVLLGSEVMPAGLGDRIARSVRLSWAHNESRIVAVAALKRPNERYRKSVFQKSGATESPSDWEVELGWIFVCEGHRRKSLARKLVAALFTHEPDRNVFATTREQNDPIMPLLKEFGFVQEGTAYASSNGAYNLLLHLRRV
jgi:GNAT superfamily N-acetyltransferase